VSFCFSVLGPSLDKCLSCFLFDCSLSPLCNSGRNLSDHSMALWFIQSVYFEGQQERAPKFDLFTVFSREMNSKRISDYLDRTGKSHQR
jgi:hypothetical protein